MLSQDVERRCRARLKTAKRPNTRNFGDAGISECYHRVCYLPVLSIRNRQVALERGVNVKPDPRGEKSLELNKEIETMKYFARVLALALLLTAGVSTATALAQTAPAPNPAATTAGDYKDQALLNLTIIGRRLVVMAQKIPAEKYTWDPGLNGRSVSELFLHAAFLQFIRPVQFGAAPPAGFTQENYEKSSTDKAHIIDQLTQAFAYSEAAVQKLSDADLQRHIKLNGADTTVAAFLHAWISDTSEYVGQAIVYSRLNGVTPPTPQSVATTH
jgi:uncharacterized damage-inducible protein DinB